MITIRLDRVGVRRKPFFRIVVVDKRVKKGGKNLDIIGFYQPGKNLKSLDSEKVKKWQEKGAKITAGVKALLAK